MIDYSALRTELLTDPKSLGYQVYIDTGNDVGLAQLLDEVRADILIRRANISPVELLEAIHPNDLTVPVTVNATLAGSWLESVLQAQDTVRLLRDDGSNTTIFQGIKRLLINNSQSEARLNAISNRTGSRAEELFGADAWVTHQDIAYALRQMAS